LWAKIVVFGALTLTGVTIEHLVGVANLAERLPGLRLILAGGALVAALGILGAREGPVRAILTLVVLVDELAGDAVCAIAG
jgi:hypothetical protein